MQQYAIIVENDESQWDDRTGITYHYPNRYRQILKVGTLVIYYKGRIQNKAFSKDRLSNDPHYFGTGVIGESIPDDQSSKKDWYCSIESYTEFSAPVLSKRDDDYLEPIPESKKSNYWRDGVRQVTQKTYENILKLADERPPVTKLPDLSGELESYTKLEGMKKERYTTYYERNPFYRKKALEIHGYSCMVCSFNFEDAFGELGKGFVHVHHNKPVSESVATVIDPKTDLSVLCPNCHAMVHRKKSYTLDVEELKQIKASLGT